MSKRSYTQTFFEACMYGVVVVVIGVFIRVSIDIPLWSFVTVPFVMSIPYCRYALLCLKIRNTMQEHEHVIQELEAAVKKRKEFIIWYMKTVVGGIPTYSDADVRECDVFLQKLRFLRKKWKSP